MYQYLPGATAVETICFDTFFETAVWERVGDTPNHTGVMWERERWRAGVSEPTGSETVNASKGALARTESTPGLILMETDRALRMCISIYMQMIIA